MQEIIRNNDHYTIRLVLDSNDNVQSCEIRSNNYKIDLNSGLGLNIGQKPLFGSVEQSIVPFKFFRNPIKESHGQLDLEFLSMHQALDIKVVLSLMDEYIHFDVDIQALMDFKCNWLRFDFHHGLEPPFDFVWVPHLKIREQNIIGDHKFWAPAILTLKDGSSFTLVPDVNQISHNSDNSLHLDIDHHHDDRISFGFRNFVVRNHIMFRSDPHNKVTFKVNSDSRTKFSFDLKIADGKSKQEITAKTARKLWGEHQEKLLKDLSTQSMPLYNMSKYTLNRLICTEVYDAYRSFDYNGSPCGGFIYRCWTGKSRGRYDVIDSDDIDALIKSPEYNSKLFRFLQEKVLNRPFLIKIIGKGAQMINSHNKVWFWNQSWFMNIRTAFGMRRLAIMDDDDDLKNKADRMANLLIEAPMEAGMFPSVAIITQNGLRWIEGMVGFTPIRDYNLVDVSLAAYWLLKYCLSFKYRQEIVLQKLNRTAARIIEMQRKDGSFPTIVKSLNHDGELLPDGIEILNRSAGCAAIGIFLCEMFRVTGKEDYLRSAEQVSAFLEHDVIPNHKWFDYETFFSCTQFLKQYGFGELEDPYTRVFPQNNMCLYWSIKLYVALHLITDNRKYLKTGQYLLDYLCLFQQIWNPPFLSVNLFGGFGCQNTDAEWSDTRQALFACELLDYYLVTHEQEYLERGIAALRASFVLLLHEENKKIAPGNFNWITKDDYGIIMENYGHQGFDVPVPGIVTPDWGTGTAVYAYTYFHEKVGDLYIDIAYDHYYGINGCRIEKIRKFNNRLKLNVAFLDGMNSFTIVVRSNETVSAKTILLSIPSRGISIEIAVVSESVRQSYSLVQLGDRAQ